MATVTKKIENDKLIIALEGHIDSSNAADIEKQINSFVEQSGCAHVELDAEKLEYISSAGLRIILRLRKQFEDLRVVNVSSSVYDIFDMTGFVEMIKVEKAYRHLSVDGCEVIGQGANGKVYRIDSDTIIKVYSNSDALDDIHKERELARKAFIMGIPTAIPYDVVKVGDTYGSVFELLNAVSFSKLIDREPENVDKYIDMYVDLLKKIHSTLLKKGEMPDMRQITIERTEFLKDYLPADIYERLLKLITDIPENNHLLHGDYHTKNVMLQNGEVLLIDMDTLCLGDPVYEFASIYLAYIGFAELDHGNIKDFLGIEYDTAVYIWRETLKRYFGTTDEEKLKEIENRAIVVGQVRLLRRTLRRLADTEKGKKQIACSKEHLVKLVPEISSLSLTEFND